MTYPIFTDAPIVEEARTQLRRRLQHKRCLVCGARQIANNTLSYFCAAHLITHRFCSLCETVRLACDHGGDSRCRGCNTVRCGARYHAAPDRMRYHMRLKQLSWRRESRADQMFVAMRRRIALAALVQATPGWSWPRRAALLGVNAAQLARSYRDQCAGRVRGPGARRRADAGRWAMNFYVGLHQPSDARRFDRCMVSVNRIRDRVSDFLAGEWMLDSAAFTELRDYGRYRHAPDVYAAQIRRWAKCGNLVAASSQDYMCEDIIINGGFANGHHFVGTHLSVFEHQRLTIERYDALLAEQTGVYILPVLQGYKPAEYVSHIRQYGSRLDPEMIDGKLIGKWVGVGSVCKRNGDVNAIEEVLVAIKDVRPDLRLHGFGVKLTALESSTVRACLHSADSMAWSLNARKNGRDANSWREADAFARRIDSQAVTRRAYQYRMELV